MAADALALLAAGLLVPPIWLAVVGPHRSLWPALGLTAWLAVLFLAVGMGDGTWRDAGTVTLAVGTGVGLWKTTDRL